MGPVDPHHLLRILSPFLNHTGGISSEDNAQKICGLMKDADRLVSQCIYINILKATQTSDLFDKLVDSGVWEVLNSWLQEAKESDNIPFLLEVLSLYKQLPVTVDLLKQNNAAKTIKQLSKYDNDDMKTLASSIVDDWMKKIRGKSTLESSVENRNEKSKDKEHTQSRDEPADKRTKRPFPDNNEDIKESGKNGKSDGDSTLDRRKKKHHHHHSSSQHHHHSKDHAPKSHKSDEVLPTTSKIIDITTSESSSSVASKEGPSSETERTPIKLIITKAHLQEAADGKTSVEGTKRAKTVKVSQQKFRSTGLLDEIIPPPKKKSVIDHKSLHTKRVSHKIDKSLEPAEKRTRPSINTSLAPVTSSFATSITSPTVLTPTESKSKPPFSKPSKVEMKDSSGFMDALIASPVMSFKKKRRATRLSGSPTDVTAPPLVIAMTSTAATSTATATTTLTNMSPTLAAKKLPTVPSFYKDLLEETVNDTERRNTPSPPVLVQQPPVSEYQPPQTMTITDSVTEATSVTSYTSQEVSTHRKSRKSVSWAAEQHLCSIMYFELDETERENVNKTRDFNEMKKSETQKERNLIQNARRAMALGGPSEDFVWYQPKEIDDISILCERGRDSLEKHIQAKREQSVLQALYFTKSMLPDSPSEPDTETYEPSEPLIIPLEDDSVLQQELTHTFDNTDVNDRSPSFPNMSPMQHVPPMQLPRPMLPGPPTGIPPGPQFMGVPPPQLRPLLPIPARPPAPPPTVTPDLSTILASIAQGTFDPTSPAMTTALQQIASLVNNDQPQGDDSINKLVEPYRATLQQYIAQISSLNNTWDPGSYNNAFNPMHRGGFPPRMRPPRPRMPMFANNGDDGFVRGPMRFMRGRGPRGFRPNFRGGNRMRGPYYEGAKYNSDWRPVCKHFNTPGGCKFGDNCAYFHPPSGKLTNHNSPNTQTSPQVNSNSPVSQS